jgi:predicted RNA-binding Zn-ribbon protein involved in translation (DUF1610 family)
MVYFISTRCISRGKMTLLAFVGILLLLLAVASSLAADSSSPTSAVTACDATKIKFHCPNCGGMQVEDCLSKCDGFPYADQQHRICIRRVLFSPRNIDVADYAHHYHYLWNDLLGMLVWFVTAAIAISAGVGGGGIYVPLGILLFQFAYVRKKERGRWIRGHHY